MRPPVIECKLARRIPLLVPTFKYTNAACASRESVQRFLFLTSVWNSVNPPMSVSGCLRIKGYPAWEVSHSCLYVGVVWYLRLSCHFSLYCKLDTGIVGQTAKLTPCYWIIDPENVLLQSASHHLRQKHNARSHLLVGAHEIILCFISEKATQNRVLRLSIFSFSPFCQIWHHCSATDSSIFPTFEAIPEEAI